MRIGLQALFQSHTDTITAKLAGERDAQEMAA